MRLVNVVVMIENDGAMGDDVGTMAMTCTVMTMHSDILGNNGTHI
jgi:hypothetical protein